MPPNARLLWRPPASPLCFSGHQNIPKPSALVLVLVLALGLHVPLLQCPLQWVKHLEDDRQCRPLVSGLLIPFSP